MKKFIFTCLFLSFFTLPIANGLSSLYFDCEKCDFSQMQEEHDDHEQNANHTVSCYHPMNLSSVYSFSLFEVEVDNLRLELVNDLASYDTYTSLYRPPII